VLGDGLGMSEGEREGIGVVGKLVGAGEGIRVGTTGIFVGLAVGMVDGIKLGEGLGIKDGACVGLDKVGSAVGLGEGINVGSVDSGVGSFVVGNLVGLGVGTTDGIELGDGVGITVGEGVVGDGVLKTVGNAVGAGVGIQVVHSRLNVTTDPPGIKPFPEVYTSQDSVPTGGVCPHLSVVSWCNAYPLSSGTLISQYCSKRALLSIQ